MASERAEVRWHRPRGIRAIHVVAALSALLALGSVLGMFNQFGASEGTQVTSERRLIASVDLRIANEAGSFARGEAQAQKDIAGGALKLRVEEPNTPPTDARAKRIEKRYGIAWVTNSDVPGRSYEARLAYVLGYNRVMQAEIERRHGAEFLGRLLRGEEPDAAAAP